MHNIQASSTPPGQLASPYDGQSVSYQRWREARLQSARQQQTTKATFIPLTPDLNTSADEDAIVELCRQIRSAGFGLYSVLSPSGQLELDSAAQRKTVTALAQRLGLNQSDDGVIKESDELSLLEDLSGTPRGRFLPYTSKAMNWHTDGYYNDINETVRCFSLHCLHSATTGGSLWLLDPELVLIALHDEAPHIVEELICPDAMLLPGNTDAEGHNRPDRRVPVLFTHADGTLGLRFTTRTQNIQWRTANAEAAAHQLASIISASCREWQSTLLLHPGQGIIARNVLHRRDSFADTDTDHRRQILRGRYLQLPASSSAQNGERRADAAC